MDTNRSYSNDQHTTFNSIETNEHYKGDQPTPADPKPGTEKPEIEVPDFDTDGTVTKSDLITVESEEINHDKTE